jgi:hypothetical protein
MRTSTPAATPLLEFLGGEGTDGAGRTLDEVLAFDDRALERHHDYIQWLFPLREPSGANPDAPVLTAAEIGAVRASPGLRGAVEKALGRMTRFYAANDHWLTAHDHNHLRITRIIRSVGLLLGPQAAERFYNGISEREARAGHPVSPRNRRYWQDAMAEVGGHRQRP